MRALLYAAVFVLVAFALLPLLRAWGRSLLSPRRSRHDELVKDPVCQTYIVLSRAVKAEDINVNAATQALEAAKTATASPHAQAEQYKAQQRARAQLRIAQRGRETTGAHS